MISAILFLLTNILLSVFAEVTHVTYLGRRIPLEEWRNLQAKFDCWHRNGSWEYNDTPIIDNISLYRKCPPPYSYSIKNPCAWILDNKSLKYDWVTETCQPPRVAFDPFKMCKIMHGRNMLFVGDSISRLHYMVMKEELLLKSDRPCPADMNEYHHMEFDCTGHSNHNFTIRLQNNDDLNLGGSSMHPIPWESLLGKEDIIVMNRGAHYRNDGDLLVGLNTTMSYLQETFPEVSIVYRNTVPGVDWRNNIMAEPLKVKPVVPNSWHWDEFEHQNEISRNFLLKVYPQVMHIDAFSATVLRQDAHYDYLHQCIPGPLTLWIDYLYNMLHLIDRAYPHKRKSEDNTSPAIHYYHP